MTIVLYAFNTTLKIKCPYEYKQTKDKKTINREKSIRKTWLSSRSLNTRIYLSNKETEKAGNFSA